MDSEENVRHGVRYVVTYNRVINEHFVTGGLIGPFYRWGGDFNGIEFVRGGLVFSYVFDTVHSVSFSPLFGASNLGSNEWVYSFTPLVQLVIRVNKNLKYIPAKYINY